MDREFEQAGYDAERGIFASVEPHWPTYHRVLRLAERTADLLDAASVRDTGDIMANRTAASELAAALDDLELDHESQAAAIWDTVTRTHRMTIKQAKALAIAAAKEAAVKGIK